MQAGQIMIRKLTTVAPDETVERAAILMARVNAGILPVVKGDRIVGLVTDRDLVVRAVAAGKSPHKVRVDEIMTEEVHFCREDDEVEEVARRMGALGVRRMPVCDRSGAPVGLISLDDVAAHVQSDHLVAETLRGIARVARAPRAV